MVKSEDPATGIKEEEHEEITETPPQRRKKRRVVVKQKAEDSGPTIVKNEDECDGSSSASKSGDTPGKQNRKRNRKAAASELVSHYNHYLHTHLHETSVPLTCYSLLVVNRVLCHLQRRLALVKLEVKLTFLSEELEG